MSKAQRGASSRDLQQVVATTDEEAAAMRDGDAAGYFAVLTDDALFLPPDQPEKQSAELREWLRDFLERFRVEWLEYVHEESVIVGDLAYHRYSYRRRVTPKAGGQPTVSSGKGLHVLQRQQDGSWKIARNLWNASPGT
jgi:ketosteroid isomerase-like protein